MNDFRGKVAVITGGASGIGFATAQALARRGARLMLADVEGPALERAVDALRQQGANAAGMLTDVGDRAAVERLAERAFAHFGAVHLVMHNAGVAVFGLAQTLSDADWAWVMQVNLWGPIHGVQAFLPRMLAQGQGGHMLFTASFAGLVPNRALAPYNVSKAGVVALAESLHKDLRSSGIGVSVLCPMRVDSRIEHSDRNRPQALGGGAANSAYADEDRAVLQGRMLAVEPVAELVLAAIGRGDLYIHTHAEAAAYLRARAERIDAGFIHAL